MKPPTPEQAERRVQQHRREEGAVLLIVVLVLMVVTATATYTVYATTAEITGAGATSTAFQTENIATSTAEATIEWIDRVGPAAVYRYAEVNSVGSRVLDLTGLEPPLADGQMGTRVYVEDLSTQGNGSEAPPPVDGSSLNNMSPYTPHAVVDVYDVYRFNGNVAGSRSDGAGQQSFLRATYTVRARSKVDLADSVDELIRNRHTTTATARAVGTSGPFNM